MIRFGLAAISLCGFLLFSPSFVLSQDEDNAEIAFFAGGFFGDSLIVTSGNPLFNSVDGVFDDDFIGGARLTYFFNPYLGIEGGVGFTPASLLASSNINGGTDFSSVISVDTYIFSANVVGQLPRGPVRPFVTGGVAAVHFNFDTSDFGTLTPSETDLALNIGGGIKIPVTDSVMLRAEARYYHANSDFAEDSIKFTEVSGGVAVKFNF
jgi:opacity protein-like surface antigen